MFLHGRGADEEDLIGLAPFLDPGFLIVSCRAPLPFPGGGFTWYHIDQVGSPESTSFRNAYNLLTRFLNDVRAGYAVDRHRVFLFGFSMGAVMSLALALTHPDAVRGVVAHSGYVPEGAALSFRWEELDGTAFFIAHGSADPVIPPSFGQRAYDLLRSTRATVTHREYRMAHQISEESLRDIVSWMKPLLEP
jgi:phospholipase/carboxylesterase